MFSDCFEDVLMIIWWPENIAVIVMCWRRVELTLRFAEVEAFNIVILTFKCCLNGCFQIVLKIFWDALVIMWWPGDVAVIVMRRCRVELMQCEVEYFQIVLFKFL
jgi:hypothetical protein